MFLSLVPQSVLMVLAVSLHLRMEATAIVPIKSSTLLLAAARMVHFLVAMSSRPRLSHKGLNGDGDVVEPLGGGHGNRLGRVLGVAAGGGDYN